MREIRFRVWDKDLKKFLNPDSWMGNFDDMYLEDLQGIFRDDGYVFQWYTGLKDKNGTEVFEGDVVRAIAEEKHSEMTIVSDVLCNTDDSGEWQVRMNQLYSHGLPVTWGGWESLEVLGNIYEHSHLLDNHNKND